MYGAEDEPIIWLNDLFSRITITTWSGRGTPLAAVVCAEAVEGDHKLKQEITSAYAARTLITKFIGFFIEHLSFQRGAEIRILSAEIPLAMRGKKK